MGDEDRNKADWKKSWKEWFQNPEGTQVKKILEKGRKQYSDEANISDLAAPELRRLTKSDRTTTEAILREQLESLTLVQLRAYISSQVVTLSREEEAWDDRRNQGWKKVTTKASQFIVDFDAFLSGFSGVVEIVKLADTQYGGIATMVLAVFFATAKLKVNNDKAIQSCMKTVANRLPDLEIYYQVYADQQLATMLSNAYTDIIVFAQTATIYFQGHGFAYGLPVVRVLKGIVQPQKFQGLEQGVGHNFEEIRLRCNALVAKRIFDLSAKNDELLSLVKSLESKIEGMEKRKDEETMRAILGRENSEPKHVRENKLAEFRKFLPTVFAGDPDIPALSLDLLKQLPEFQTWEKTDCSMLVLHGYNHTDHIAPQSWLSLAALDLVHDLHSITSSTVVTHCNCDNKMRPEEVMKSVVEQLLEQQPHVLRRGSDADVIEYHLKLKGENEFDGYCQAIAQILQKCIAPVYIVINRPEVCRGDETWALMESLLRLVENATGKVKILAVLRTERWNIGEWLKCVSKKTLESKKLLVLRKDQFRCQ